MADTQPAPATATDGSSTPPPPPGGYPNDDGSLESASREFLGLLEPDEGEPEDVEAQPTEVDESDDESTEEEASETESEEELEEEEEDDEEEEEEEEEGPELYPVKVDGKEELITLDELQKSYLRQSDYSRKTASLSESRKEFEGLHAQMAQERQLIQQEREQYVNSLQDVITGSMQSMDKYKDVDWDSLKESDPIEYLTQQNEMRESQERIRALHNERLSANEKYQQEAVQQHREMVNQETAKMIEALPDWAEPDKQRELSTQLRDYALGEGYIDEELNQLVDHRSLLVLRKAMLYDQMQKTDLKSKKVKNAPKLVRSSTRADKKTSSAKRRNTTLKRLEESGHINDAAAAFEELLGD